MTANDLVDDLCRVQSYPAPLPGAVELRTTHISWVFLTEDAAYKVKRPIDFGFVDFTSRERRLHFCQEELRLNRRLAPEVYQAVVPIHRGAGGHNLRGDGPIVDHAVRMRRLPDQASAAAMLRAGQLRAEHLARLAARLARFFAEATPTPQLGGLATLRDNVADNLAGLRPFAGTIVPANALAQAAEAQTQGLLRHARAIEQRNAEGRVRDGHGDLRLEHVYFDRDGAPLVIDALEFNPRFRCADVALDVAFLAMELEAAGAAALGRYFIYRYARESNDYGLYPLLDFYLAYRALVRAKIACLVAADAGTSEAKRARKRQEAIDLVQLAQRYGTLPRRRPLVAAVGGLTGSGKSTLAEALAQTLGLPVVSSDATRKHLAGLPADQRAPEAAYDDSFSARTYAEVIRRADLVLASGRGVILDATFRSEAMRRCARELAACHDARFVFIEATCAEATLRARLRERQRGPSESDADLAVLEQVRAQYQPPDELPPDQRLSVDTGRGLEPLTRELAPQLRALGGFTDLASDP